MKFLSNYDLTSLNTFHLSAHAAYFYELSDIKRLPELIKSDVFQDNEVLFIGGGSNIIFTQDFAGLVVRINSKGIRIVEENEDFAIIEAAAGEDWHSFVMHTLALGLNGLENLSLIPGSVGASPVQNIGAYGVEVKDCIDTVQCFDLQDAKEVVFANQECDFAYRDSFFKQAGKGRYVITSVRFKLSKTFTPKTQYGGITQALADLSLIGSLNAKNVSKAVCYLRQSKLPDPKELGNAGSFFKNPIIAKNQADELKLRYPDMPQYSQDNGQVKCAAGWLIEHANLKGHQIGGAAVHQKQALVLVNKGDAVAADILSLAAHVQAVVEKQFGIDLEPEPLFV